MSQSYQTMVHEDQRLVILRILSEMAGFEANDSVLQTILDHFGHNIGRDLVLSHLHFLAEQGLVSLESLDSPEPMNNITVATLSGRGEDVAQGRAVCAGVKKPRAKR